MNVYAEPLIYKELHYYRRDSRNTWHCDVG